MAKHGENIYKRKDGRYEGRYVIGRKENGRTRFGYVYGRQYAQVRSLLLQKKAQQLENCGWQCARGMTVERWMLRWLEGDVQWRVKPSTFQTYLRHFRCYVQPLLGSMDITRLSADDVRGMLCALSQRGLSAGTMRCALRLLSAAMESAVEDGMLHRNPCRRLRMAADNGTEQRVLSRAEQEQLRAQAGQEDLPALVGLYTGMRLGEVCALMWQDVDWEQRTITVRRTVQRLPRTDERAAGAKTALAVSTPKTLRSRRVIPMPDFLLQRLKQQMESNQSAWIFGTDEQAAEPRTIQRRFDRLTAKMGVTGVHFHTLRHTFATRLLELGADAKTVSVLMGHSSVRTTLDLYVHSLIENQRLAMERLNNV